MLINTMALVEEFKELFTNLYIHVFIFAVLVDIASGLLKGFITKKANSTSGVIGIAKHMLVVFIVLMVYPYLQLLTLTGFASAFIYFYISVYVISILENLSQMGIPFPDFIVDRIEKMKNTNNKGE